MNISRKIRPHLYLFLFTLSLTSVCRAQMEFIENKGQWDSRVNFKGDFSSGSFYLENNGFTVQLNNPDDLKKVSELMHGHGIGSTNSTPKPTVILRSHAYKVDFLGSSPAMKAVPDKMVPAYNNYFIGNDHSKWAEECRIYNAVTYSNVYPNIDVRYYSDGNKLKYDFIVKPGGNVNAIAMRYQGVEKLQVKNKELLITTSIGDIKELYPYSYQVTNGKRMAVDCKYVVKGNIVRFKVDDYPANSTLIVDPSLIFSSFSGSTADNWGFTATPGPDGSFFMGGVAYGDGFRVSPGAYQTTFGGGVLENGLFPYDIAIMKLSPDGRRREYATYLGGSGNEQPHSLMCDAQGNLVMAGRSFSINYPVTTPNTALGGYDIVVTKFNSAGGLLSSTKIGGTNSDGVNIRHKYANPSGTDATRRNYGDDARSEVILDAAGNVYVASCSQSTDFPVSSAGQALFGGGRQDGVIIKFTPNLNLTFSTYFGGGGDDAAFVLSLNPLSGVLYVAGGTTSGALPGDRTGVINGAYQGGDCDGFVTTLSSAGGPFLKTSYMGTSGSDMVYGIQFDKFGFPYVMGTSTGNWPVINATFSNPGSKQFISKLQPDLSAYVYSTVFGTAAAVPNLSPVAFLVDRCQNVYVSGWGGGLNISQFYQSAGTNGLTEINPIPGLPPADGADFYFFVMEKDAKSQLFGTHFGQSGGLGDHVDGGTSRFDANGIIYQGMCANCDRDFPFPTTAGVWAVNNGSVGCNQAAVKIEMNFSGVGASVKATIDGLVDTVGCVPLTIRFTDTLAKGKMYIWHFGDPLYTKSDTTYAPDNFRNHTYTQVGTYRLMLVSIDSATCNIADTAYINVKVGNNEVTPDFSFTKLDNCSSLRYEFTNLTTAVLPNYTNKTFVWDFGDGSPRVRTGFSPQIHTYPSTGTYQVTLVVDDTTFCNSPDSIKKTLRISANVKAQFETDPIGCVPHMAQFTNTSIGGTDFIWEFGDTQTSTDPNPTHEYTAVGTYNVRLIAIDDNTCNKRDTSAYFTITVYPIPTANFTWAPNPAEENRPTRFTNLSVGATRYLWSFGDGETSTQVNPVHQYNETGTFKVTLYAYNVANCVDSLTLDVQAIIKPLLDVPNAFTPGRFTGSADVIKVMGFGIGQISWKIYNRWGQVVFQTEDRKQGWDGTFKGVVQPMDVYTYTLDVVFTDGKKFRKTGDITLLK